MSDSKILPTCKAERDKRIDYTGRIPFSVSAAKGCEIVKRHVRLNQ